MPLILADGVARVDGGGDRVAERMARWPIVVRRGSVVADLPSFHWVGAPPVTFTFTTDAEGRICADAVAAYRPD